MLLIGNEEGFTLLEVLIVLVLITALVTVNLPNFEKYLESIETRGQLLRVEHLFRGIRERSISQQQKVEVKIHNTGLIYMINNEEEISFDLEIVNRSVDNITYYPDGTSSGGAFTISILDKHKYSANIDIITGKLDWEKQILVK